MRLHGTIESNLAAAVNSARRLRGQRVHSDTLDFWQGLVSHARRELQGRPDIGGIVGNLVVELESEIGGQLR